MRVTCFGCRRAAKEQNCALRQNKKSGIRRWFHKEEIKSGCMVNKEDWPEVDRSLGETTKEEIMQLYGD